MKLVIDTNVLVSGSLWDGSSTRLLDAVGRKEATLLTSPDLLVLQSFQGIPIITVVEALRRLGLQSV